MEDLHKTVTRLENILGKKKWENSKELTTFSPHLSELHNENDNLHVSADDATDHITSLEGKLDRTTQLVDAQTQINTNVANRLNRIEASDAANPSTPVPNREPQTLNIYPPITSAAPQRPPAFHNRFGPAGYIPPGNQPPLVMALRTLHPLKLRTTTPSVKTIAWCTDSNH